MSCADDPILPALVRSVCAHVISYGLEAGDWQAHDITVCRSGVAFRVVHGKSEFCVSTPLAGLHNVRNTLAALAVAHQLGVSEDEVTRALVSFPGVERRADVKGEAGGILVVDDYAHHPTEIQVNLVAFKQRFGRPIRVIFQPHTYSRTKYLFDDFAKAFGDADAVYLLDIYAAREKNDGSISGRHLADALARQHPHVTYAETPEVALDCLLAEASAGDLVVTMGAGDVNQLGPRLLERLRRR
jgi:UDP-N-acetylmuramate--alanine ligase